MKKHKGKSSKLDVLDLYGAMLLLYFSLRYTISDELPFVAFCANCIPLILLPAIIALPIALKNGKRFMILWSGVTSVFLILEFGPRFVPVLNQTLSSTALPLRILSHNTGQDLPDYKQRDQLIRASEADIVVLQEVTDTYIEKHWPHFLTAYPYQIHGPLQSDRGMLVGMGVLSRYPIVEHNSFKLDEEGLVYQLRVLIDVAGQQIAVYNIHTTFPWFRPKPLPLFTDFSIPTYDDRVRRAEIQQLIKILSAEQHPVILTGDFNFTDQSSDYQALLKIGLTDAYRSAGYGLGFTWPANRTPSVNIWPAIPFARVDYLFCTTELTVDFAQVLTKTGSDHLPILIDLSLPGKE